MPTHSRKTIASTTLATAILLALGGSNAQAYFTSDGSIYDASGEPVQLRGISWFGFETPDAHLHGLWTRNLEDSIAQMQSIGINAIRLPFCPDTLRGIEPLSVDYNLNPDLQGLDSLQLLDRAMQRFDEAGMHILLDHHRPDCNAISELWYTDRYSERDWINDLVFVTERYRDLPYFMGMDLKNEPHGVATWGTGNDATDWNLAAERASREVLAVKPDLLVFVEGIGSQSFCTGPINHFWGGNLEPLNCAPLDIPASQLVLSPHVYGPDVFDQTYFQGAAFPANMPAIWETQFGFTTTMGYTVVVGEWGGRYGIGGEPRDRVWQDAFVDWLDSKGLHSSFYWSWNPNSGDTGGVLADDWQTLQQPKVELLQRHWRFNEDTNPGDGTPPVEPPVEPPVQPPVQPPVEPPVEPPVNPPVEPPVEPPSSPDPIVGDRSPIPGTSLSLQLTRQDDWAGGYCRHYIVSNGGEAVSRWQVRLAFSDEITNVWNATAAPEGPRRIVITPARDNASILPGGETTFGFCANRKAAPTAPATTALPVELFVSSDWGHGYCSDARVRNTSNSPVVWSGDFDVEGTVVSHWNANLSANSGRISASGVDWNRQIAAGGAATFGFCAQR